MNELTALSQRTYSFWKKPEGKIGMAIIGAFILIAGGILYKALPYLIKFVNNLTDLVGSIIALGAISAPLIFILWLLVNDATRAVIGGVFKRFVRFITGLDPVSVAKAGLKKLAEKLDNLLTEITNVGRNVITLKRKKALVLKEIQDNMELAEEAQRQQKSAEYISVYTNKAVRRKGYLVRIEDLINKLEAMQKILQKYHEAGTLIYTDKSDDLALREQEYNSFKGARRALRSAWDLLKGKGSASELYDDAMDIMANEIDLAISEMDQFMITSKDVINSIDLEQGAASSQSMKLLEEWQKDKNSFLLKPETKRELLEIPGHVQETGEELANDFRKKYF